MTIDLKTEGESLQHDLEALANRCHPRSDTHDTFLWESSVVGAHVIWALGGEAPSETLNASVLGPLTRRYPEVAARVHDLLERCRSMGEAPN